MNVPIFRVYVSSTWKDLQPEREAVREAVLRMKQTQFVGMEYFGSRDETTREASLKVLDDSSLYVGIFAARYGSGITEDEYRRAHYELGLPCFIFFKDDATINDDSRETDPDAIAKLDALRKLLRANHLSSQRFVNPDDLATKVATSLHNWLFDEYLTPKLKDSLLAKDPTTETQTLLDAVKDFRKLNSELLTELKGKGYNISIGGDYVAGDKVEGDKVTNIFNAPIPPVPTLHQLRAPVGDFVGREKEIAELTATLRGDTSAAIIGISGMGGVGKTELALYVAGRLRDAYPDAQLVVDMRGTNDPPRNPTDALAACIRAFLGLEQRLPGDLQELTRIYRSVLEGKRALILLDNAFDGAQVRPLLPPAGSALLITSRSVVTLPRMTRITLEQLQPSEARELLRGIAPRIPEDVADRICSLCGYLPLAIRAAGSLLDVTIDLDPETYAEQLSDERQRLELIGTEGVDLGVEASFGLSYARLSPDDARVFRQLAVFPTSFNARAEEGICEDPGHKHLSQLLRRNLVLYNEDTRRYRLHDLARLFADSRMSDDERGAARIHHAAYYLTVLEACNVFYMQGGKDMKSGLALFDAERRNIEAGQEWVCQHASGDEAASLCNSYPGVGVYVLNLRLHPREFIFWLEAALAAARQLKDRASEGMHSGSLGNVYGALGDMRRAIEFHKQHLTITRELGDRHGEGSALGNLGICYKNLGEPRRAVEFYEQALVIDREIGNRRGEGQDLGNLGNAYGAFGDTRRAIEYHEQALVVLREIGDRRSEAASLGNLGNAYTNLGEPQRAIEFYEQALVIDREIGDRHSEAQDLGNLGVVYAVLGETRRAIEFYEQVLIVLREMGDRHGEGSTLGNLGNAYANLGEMQRAVEFYEQYLAIAREIGDRRGEGIVLYNICLALDKLGDRAKAIAHAEAALEIFEQIESPAAEKVRATLAQWHAGA
jgi:tetratricopeptide (TPR) repeat protein